MKKAIMICIILSVFLLTIPYVIGNPLGFDNTEWKTIKMQGKCESISYSFGGNLFSLWCTRQPINLNIMEETEIVIDGENYPLDANSTIVLRGFIGKAIWPYTWTLNHNKGMEPPYDFTVFGIVKYVEVL